MTHVIYGFREIGSTELSYVGQTKHSGAHRFGYLRSLARTKTRGEYDAIDEFSIWLRGDVEVIELGSARDEQDARRRERETIEACLAMGHRLFNRHHVPASLRTPRATRGGWVYAPAQAAA